MIAGTPTTPGLRHSAPPATTPWAPYQSASTVFGEMSSDLAASPMVMPLKNRSSHHSSHAFVAFLELGKRLLQGKKFELVTLRQS